MFSCIFVYENLPSFVITISIWLDDRGLNKKLATGKSIGAEHIYGN